MLRLGINVGALDLDCVVEISCREERVYKREGFEEENERTT